MKKTILLITAITFLFTACKKDEPLDTQLTINFTQTINSNTISQDNLNYTNAANQNYSVKQLAYLISDITLHDENGGNTLLKEMHFIDIDKPKTLSFTINKLADAHYTSVSFTFGLDTSKNISNLYVNEDFHSTMAWPDMMGGGYHYMILEGNFNNDTTFYNTHIGGTMGMDFSFSNSDAFNLSTNAETSSASLTLNMEVNNWYNSPNEITLTTDGIMGNSNMQMHLKQNGADVFSTTID